VVSFLPTALAQTNPAALPPVGYSELNILTPTLLELSLITTKNPDPAPPTWNFVASDYSLQLPPSSEFDVRVGNSAISVSQIGFKRRPLSAPVRVRDLRIQNSLYLKLSAPIPDNAAVVVKNPSSKLWSTNTQFTAISSPFRFKPALHVNQVGYLPSMPKKAMIGAYLGSFGELPITATNFNILNASSNIVFSGALHLRKDTGFVYSPTPYQQVYKADFTPLNTAGDYRLQVPGMGTSYPFLINDSTAATFARALMLGFYHERCGEKNELPYTRFVHDVCHVAPAEVPTMAFTAVNQQLASMTSDFSANPRHTAPQLKDVDSSLYPFVNPGPVDVSLGHHDAGDYSKYTINSAALIHYLVFSADNFPGAGKLDNLGIPESGDGKSDLLQEARWEANFLSKMQDRDGGFYFLVYPRDRAYEDDVLPDHGDPQVVFPKTTAVTAAAVGALAEIASSPLFRQQYPTDATNYFAKAVAGWKFLTNAITKYGKDGSYQKITHYGNEFMHDDELAWAAAAMFAATGDPAFQAQLIQWYDPADPQTRRWTWWRLFEGYGCAARTFAFAPRNGRLTADKLDPAYRAKIEAEIIAAADDVARFAQENAYGTSFPDPDKAQQNAGWYFSTERAFDVAVAQQLAPQPRYLDALLGTVNYEAGCNPVNMPYITGLGWRRWHEIVSQYGLNDTRVLPPSGIPVGNIVAGFTWLDLYQQELGELCYPPDGATSAPYPFYDRWADTFNTTAEATVMDMGRSLGTYTWLLTQTPGTNSAVVHTLGTITGVPSTTPAGQPVTAQFQVNGIDLKNARILWEATDQEPFIGPAFTFSPKNPGEQWIEVEAQLPDGNRLFGTNYFSATASASIPPNSFESKPLSVTSDLIALYHLDNNPADATGRNAPLTLQGNARFDSLNLAWMSPRSGAAIRVRDLGDQAGVTIPAAVLNAPNDPEITVEAMVYVNDYKAYNRASASLLSLSASWNASLAWIDDLYSGPHITGGTQFDIFGSSLADKMPAHQWQHLSITIGPANYSARIDGQLIASVSSSELPNWNGLDAVLQFGNFDGWIDEVVVRNSRPNTPQSGGILPPSILTATASNTVVRLAWNTVINATYYHVKRATAQSGPFITITTTAKLSFADTAVQNETTYYYVVSALNSTAESADTTPVSATPHNPPLAPSSLNASGLDRSQVKLTWTDRSSNESGFEIERATGTTFTRIATAPANTTTFTDTGLQPATLYNYRLRAINSGGPSPYSNTDSARTRR